MNILNTLKNYHDAKIQMLLREVELKHIKAFVDSEPSAVDLVRFNMSKRGWDEFTHLDASTLDEAVGVIETLIDSDEFEREWFEFVTEHNADELLLMETRGLMEEEIDLI